VRRIDHRTRVPSGSDPANFVLPATTQKILGPDDGEAVRLYRVAFEEGARTYWHAHDGVQLLHGLGGRCVVVDRDGTELFLDPGDVVVVEAGEEHWHGAAPGGGGVHLAINLGERTKWLESSE
jgi:quercetin dioxygenase-like cupin family protein